jgi:hypothetical protein
MKYILTVGLLSFNVMANAQNEVAIFSSASPKGSISQVVGNTKIDIEYERPLARNRKIFGDLVPWNRLWRTGAGASTKIKFDCSTVLLPDFKGEETASKYQSRPIFIKKATCRLQIIKPVINDARNIFSDLYPDCFCSERKGRFNTSFLRRGIV